MRGELWRLQYEGLHNLRFGCGRYGHRDATCPLKKDKRRGEGNESNQPDTMSVHQEREPQSEEQVMLGYGDWMVVQRNHRRPARTTRDISKNSAKNSKSDFAGGNRAES